VGSDNSVVGESNKLATAHSIDKAKHNLSGAKVNPIIKSRLCTDSKHIQHNTPNLTSVQYNKPSQPAMKQFLATGAEDPPETSEEQKPVPPVATKPGASYVRGRVSRVIPASSDVSRAQSSAATKKYSTAAKPVDTKKDASIRRTIASTVS